MEIKAILVDDEYDGRVVLEHHISKHCDNVKLIHSFSNSEDAIAFLKNNKIDLLFLDINMPNKNGFDLLDEIKNHDFKIIFVTAYDQYAIKAIKYAAFDYLLKPIDPEELKEAIEKLKNKRSDAEQINVLKQNLKEENLSQIALPTKYGYSYLSTDKIIRCEGDSNYCKIYFWRNG